MKRELLNLQYLCPACAVARVEVKGKPCSLPCRQALVERAAYGSVLTRSLQSGREPSQIAVSCGPCFLGECLQHE